MKTWLTSILQIGTDICYDRNEIINQLTSDINCMNASETSQPVHKMLDAVYETSSGAEKNAYRTDCLKTVLLPLLILLHIL